MSRKLTIHDWEATRLKAQAEIDRVRLEGFVDYYQVFYAGDWKYDRWQLTQSDTTQPGRGRHVTTIVNMISEPVLLLVDEVLK